MVDYSSHAMGVNFSSKFMSSPVAAAHAVGQIVNLPVGRAKTFSYHGADLQFIQAAAAVNLRLAVGIPNGELHALAHGNANALIGAIQPYASTIDLICVGNEPLGAWQPPSYGRDLVPAMQNVQQALQSAGLHSIGVTVPFNFSILSTSYPPSSGSFNSNLVACIQQAAAVMSATGAPFMVNVYPFLDRVSTPQIPLRYCLFTAPQSEWVYDGQYTYKNIFDASLDALYVAMVQAGLPNLNIVVGETGWPTQGNQFATVTNAQTFNQNLIKHCKSGTGTPRRPARQIGCYVFEMYDEAQKPTTAGAWEPYWGIYNASLQAKYALTW